jgi:drug/metabolite transporter (DMT)-like permease
MIAFAANSVLCRLALGEGWIDASSFTTVRLVGGAAALALVVRLRRGPARRHPHDLVGVLSLFAYAAGFSFAYLSLTAATGTLILFGAVQLTMIVGGLLAGERPRASAWLGVALAVAGMGLLVAPGVAAPSPAGAALMGVAGSSWGLYSLRGRASADATASTAGNFLGTVPLALLLVLLPLGQRSASAYGLGLALASGVLTSGLGYVVWYAALPLLTPVRAATVQLSVPVLVAVAGVLVLAEPLTPRLLVSGLLTLGGIGLVIRTRAADG